MKTGKGLEIEREGGGNLTELVNDKKEHPDWLLIPQVIMNST